MPVWQQVDLSGVEDGGGCTAMHGAYTGAAMPTGEGFLPFKKPRYLIERMACHQPGDDAAASAPPHYCYRVTAIGFGSRPETEVVLQSVFSKPEKTP
jgi:type IV pilus assembly protein PilX